MAVVQLATSVDVKAALGRDLTAPELVRVEAILDKASELFRSRRYSGQLFTAGTSTVRLKVTADYVTLVQRPVVSVESVTMDDGTAVAFDRFGGKLTLTGVPAGSFVRVSYAHGGAVPELVRLTIAEIAKKVLSIAPAAAAGMTSNMRVTGPFTDQETYATWAQGGQTMLSPDDAATALSFRVKSYGSIIQVP